MLECPGGWVKIHTVPCSLGVCCTCRYPLSAHWACCFFLNQTILHSSSGTYVAPWMMDPSLHSSCPHEHSVDGGQRGHQVLDLRGCRHTLLRKQRFLRAELRGKSKHAGGRSRRGEGVIWGTDSRRVSVSYTGYEDESFFLCVFMDCICSYDKFLLRFRAFLSMSDGHLNGFLWIKNRSKIRNTWFKSLAVPVRPLVGSWEESSLLSLTESQLLLFC